MAFSKVKNFTEKDMVRVKAAVIKGKITNKLTIYIGGEVYDKYFGDSKSAFAKVVRNEAKEICIMLTKSSVDPRYKEYKFCITGHGTCKTRKLLVSIPDSVTNDLSKYVENRTVMYYTGIHDSLTLNLDRKEPVDIEAPNKKPKKVKRQTIFHEDPVSLHKKYKDKFDADKFDVNKFTKKFKVIAGKNSLNKSPSIEDNQYKPEEVTSAEEVSNLRNDLNIIMRYRYDTLIKDMESIKSINEDNIKVFRNLEVYISQIQEHFDTNNKVQVSILHSLTSICKKLNELETSLKEKTDDSIKETTSKETNDYSIKETTSKETNDGPIKDFVLENIINRIESHSNILKKLMPFYPSISDRLHSINERLEKLEDKPKEDKRSLFAKVFGE
jgi:hypothetical protein